MQNIQRPSKEFKKFLSDLELLKSMPTTHLKSIRTLSLAEYPFDLQLLTVSSLYRRSRRLYISLGGKYSSKMCSTMRALSAQDLFKDEIEYSPSFSEMRWLAEHYKEVVDPNFAMKSLLSFSDISLFHEQNHRILWRMLPRAPKSKADFCRYLNFAESLVVTLDLALGDEVGAELSQACERIKILYRPAGKSLFHKKTFEDYLSYLKALMYATYLCLELCHPDDILKAVDYVLPGQRVVNKVAVKRALELNELFIFNTNQQWQSLYWQKAQEGLSKVQKRNKGESLMLPLDPLDFGQEFVIVEEILKYFILG